MSVGKLKLLEKLPVFQRWYVAQSTATGSIEESLTLYESIYASFDQMVLYLELFHPEFIEVKGLILRAVSVPDNLDDVINRTKREDRPLASIEYLYNHVHLHDFCSNDPDHDEIPQDVVRFIAKTLADMWRMQLTSRFPDKKFVVGIGNEDAEVEVFAYVDRGDLLA